MKIILASKSPARKKLLEQLGLKFSVVPAEIDEEKIRLSSPSATVKKIALLKAKKVLGQFKKDEDLLIISADTMVYIPNSKLKSQKSKFIGKPKNKLEAENILDRLSDTTHWLYSGLCVLQIVSSCHSRSNPRLAEDESVNNRRRHSGLSRIRFWMRSFHSLTRMTNCIGSRLRGNDKVRVFLDFDKSKVTFRKLSPEEIKNYAKNNLVTLWAGAYTIEKGTPGASFIKEIKGSNSNVLGLPVKKLKRILERLI